MLVALAQLTQLALRSVETAQWRQQEELSAAALHMERAQETAAERDHELRNGLAGLAGITHLLSTDGGSQDHERLKHAVLAELGRLHAILDGGLLAVGPTADYAVEPVIAGLVALRASSTVTLDVTPGLEATGDPAVLAQIVTNLLVNAERHAPGAPVAITARAPRQRRDRRGARRGPRSPAGRRAGGLGAGFRARAADQQAPGRHSRGSTSATHSDEPTRMLGYCEYSCSATRRGRPAGDRQQATLRLSPVLIIPFTACARILFLNGSRRHDLMEGRRPQWGTRTPVPTVDRSGADGRPRVAHPCSPRRSAFPPCQVSGNPSTT